MRTKTLQGLFLPAPRLNQLHILKQIASNSDITQAELAQRCALSVAMVNNYMKELLRLGLLEYRRKSSKSISYHLTAAGREATEATGRELVLELVKLFGEAKERVREIILSQARGGLRRVVLYGSGGLAELALHALESTEAKIVAVCDVDSNMIGQDWCGRQMMNPSQILHVAPDTVIIACDSRTNEVYNSLTCLQEGGIHLIRLDSSIFNGSSGESTSSSDLTEDPQPSLNKQAI